MIGTSIIKELSLLKAITSYYTILPSNFIGPISKRGSYCHEGVLAFFLIIAPLCNTCPTL